MSQPLKANDSVEWIVRAAKNTKYNIKIVPISIMWDRIFDSTLFSHEVLSGKFEELTMYKLMRKIYEMPAGKVGKVYVKYSEPIDMTTYLEANKI